jgi:CelD/BcsL family acetyltransferase involved in cellulose biosynthesis
MTEILMARQDTVGQMSQTREASTEASTIRSSIEVGACDSIQANAENWARLCDEIQSPPFHRPEWIRIFVESFEGNSKLVLLTAHKGEKLSAILPLTRKRCWFAGVPVVKLTATANIHSVYFDIPQTGGEGGEKSTAQVWTELKEFQGWHVVELPLIPEKGPAQDLLRHAQEDGYTTLLIPFHESPVFRMQSDANGQLNPLTGTSRHFRHELRRFARLYREQTGQDPQVVRRTKPGLNILDNFFQLEASGWKGAEQSAINCAKETQNYYTQIATEAAAGDYFSLYSLETEKGMIAGAFCVETRDCIFPMKIAYDERMHRTGPGQLLFNGILADCAQRGIATLFFGGKKNRFKAAWTSETTPFFTGFIFNRGLRAKAAYRSRVSVISRLGKLRRALQSRFAAK